MLTRILATIAVLLVAACAQKDAAPSTRFDTPEEAVESFVAALRANDQARLAALLGPEAHALLHSGDDVQATEERRSFLEAYAMRHALVGSAGKAVTLEVGESRWALPIPIVPREGRWEFDAAGGADELVLRRIGRNELAALDVCRGVLAAQREFAALNGGYATRLRSDPGQRNGLYWEAPAGEPQSPAGPLLARAAAEGYDTSGAAPTPYHGYFYRIVGKAPGANDGFAVVAWPAEYGASGIMTFVLDQDGSIYQKDLGEEGETQARALGAFRPDDSWSRT